MIQAVIFDMDGLIVDSEPLQSQGFEAVIKEYGKKPILFENGLVHPMGMVGSEIWEILKEKHKISEDTEVLKKRKWVLYKTILENSNMQPLPGLLTLLNLLKKENIPM